MLLDDDEANSRLDSPMNLINRMRSARSHNGSSPLIPSTLKLYQKQDHVTQIIPVLPDRIPSADELVEDLENKLAITNTNRDANSIISQALTELKSRIPEISKPENLAKVAGEMGKLMANMREANSIKGITNKVIVYAPQLNVENDFEVIVVSE